MKEVEAFLCFRRIKLCLIAAPKTEHYFLSFFIHLLFISREFYCKFHFVSPPFTAYNDFFLPSSSCSCFHLLLKLSTNKFKNDKEQITRGGGMRESAYNGNVIQMSYYFIQIATRRGGRQEEKWNGRMEAK